MKTHTIEELRYVHAEATFRTSPWITLFLPAFLLVPGLGIAWAVWNGHLPRLAAAASAFFCLLSLFVFVGNFLPALKSTNWVLKTGDNRIHLMLCDYRSARFAGDLPVVASFEMREIQSIGRHEKLVSIPASGGGTTKWKELRLEMRFAEDVTPELDGILKQIPVWQETWYGRKRSPPSPVTTDGETVRVLWRGRFSAISPRLERAIEILSRDVPVHAPTLVDCSRPTELNDAEFDDHILELCQAGNRFDAIRLLRRHRNYSLVEARRFVDEISG